MTLETTNLLSPKVKKKRSLFRERKRNRQLQPALRFTPTAWAKLRFLRDLGPTEVGGFAISWDGKDLLCITDVVLVEQYCTSVTVEFDDQAVAEFFEDQITAGRRPEECGRIWLHSHPGDSPYPSGVDEETFERCFGACDWAVMAIIAQNDATYARLRWRHPAPAEMEIPVLVDFSKPFAASEQADWQREYAACVHEVVWHARHDPHEEEFAAFDDWWLPGDELVSLAPSGEVSP
jgi:proteasome lid subunit RPN8/RPN11